MDLYRVCSSCLANRNMTINFAKGTLNFFSKRLFFYKRQMRLNQSRVFCSSQNTVDEDEVIKLSKSGSDWWDVNGEFHALHSMNRVRVPFVKRAILGHQNGHALSPASPLRGLKILDVGCGGGILSEALARLGASVTGVDASARNIHVAMRHVSHDPLLSKRLCYECITVQELADRGQEAFDCVVSSEVIEHVTEKGSFVSAIADLMKPGASLVFTTLGQTTKSYLAAIVAAEYLTRMVTPGTHEWHKFIAAEDLKELLQRYGLETVNIQGMCYNPVTSNWSLIGDPSVNYALHSIKTDTNVAEDIPDESTTTRPSFV